VAGIYIHIPFCKQACHYCNFHFSTSLKHKKSLLIALLKEIELRKSYLNGEYIETLYIGGGTPSLLNIEELKQIFDKIYKTFNCRELKEITLEANPDDLSLLYLKELKRLPVNRLSIGIQSFNNEDLLWMNRSHNAKEALSCVENSQSVGFTNLNIDLIYGLPKTLSNSFQQNLETFVELDIPHLSAYCLTVEPKTALAHQIKNNISPPINEHEAADEMLYLMNYIKAQGYEQYEISNFAKANQYALHNTNYWKQVNYIGIGPSAHSFNGHSRQWNIANNALYIKALQSPDSHFYTEEQLSRENRFNEYIMTSLRTQWGINLEYIEETFDGTYISHLLSHLKNSSYVKDVHYVIKQNCIILLEKGKLLADGFAADLFLTS